MEIMKKHKIQLENEENHENHRIQCQKHEIMKIIEIHVIINKILMH